MPSFNLKKYNEMIELLKEEGGQIQQPQRITQMLKIHQKRLVYEMIQKETNFIRKFPGINLGFVADKVGSGKSISMLSLVASNLTIDYNEDISNTYTSSDEDNDELIGFLYDNSKYINTNLIIVPHNIYHQWVEYITQNTTLSYLCIQGKSDITQWRDSSNPLKMLNTLDLVLVKSTKINDFLTQVSLCMGILNPKIELKYNPKYNDKIHELFKLNSKINLCRKTNNILKYVTQVYEVFELVKSMNIQQILYQRNLMKQIIQQMHQMSGVYFGAQDLECLKLMVFQLEPVDQRIIQRLSGIIKDTQLRTCCTIYDSLLPIVTKYQIADLLKDISSDDNYVGLLKKWNGPTFKRIFIDEIDTIKIPQSIPMYGIFNWYVTSSISTLTGGNCKIQSSGFLRELLYSSQKYIAKNTLKNMDELIDFSFKLDEPILVRIMCTADRNVQILSDFTSVNVLNALNADDVITAAQMLGFDQIGDQDIPSLFIASIDTKIAEKHKKLTQKIQQLSIIQQQIDQETDKDDSDRIKKQKYDIQYQIKKKQASIQALQDKKIVVQERIKSVLQLDCPICMYQQKNPTILPCCKISICFKCIAIMQQSKSIQTRQIICPLCRQHCEPSNSILVVKKGTNEQKTKLDTLLELIQQKPQGKFLVFSEFEHGFLRMRDIFEQNNIKYDRICGTSNQVQQIVFDFQYGRTQVLLLDAKFFGSGLNLQFATDIICYHNMRDDLKQQIIGRGQRVGRTERLTVTFLCNTTEQIQQ